MTFRASHPATPTLAPAAPPPVAAGNVSDLLGRELTRLEQAGREAGDRRRQQELARMMAVQRFD
jgi:hypothetical protein